jgi:hypothetical protein
MGGLLRNRDHHDPDFPSLSVTTSRSLCARASFS